MSASIAEVGRVVLLGSPGTGKTMLLQALRRTLHEAGHVVRMVDARLPLGPIDEDDVVLVDEADALSTDQLRQFGALPNPLVLAGLPTLRSRAGIVLGVTGAVSLDPVAPDDVAAYVRIRLTAAGRSAAAFAPGAVSALAGHSGGQLRSVITLASAALFFAELRRAAVVTKADIDEAAAMRAAIVDEDTPDASPVELPRLEPMVAAVIGSETRRSRVMRVVAAGVLAIGLGVCVACADDWTTMGAAEPQVTTVPPSGDPAPLSPKHRLVRTTFTNYAVR